MKRYSASYVYKLSDFDLIGCDEPADTHGEWFVLAIGSSCVVLYRLADDGTAFSCFEMRSVGDLQNVVEMCPAVVRSAYDEIAKRYERRVHTRGAGMHLRLDEC